MLALFPRPSRGAPSLELPRSAVRGPGAYAFPGLELAPERLASGLDRDLSLAFPASGGNAEAPDVLAAERLSGALAAAPAQEREERAQVAQVLAAAVADPAALEAVRERLGAPGPAGASVGADVLRRLEEAHAKVAAAGGAQRLSALSGRLGSALEAARAGDAGALARLFENSAAGGDEGGLVWAQGPMGSAALPPAARLAPAPQAFTEQELFEIWNAVFTEIPQVDDVLAAARDRWGAARVDEAILRFPLRRLDWFFSHVASSHASYRPRTEVALIEIARIAGLPQYDPAGAVRVIREFLSPSAGGGRTDFGLADRRRELTLRDLRPALAEAGFLKPEAPREDFGKASPYGLLSETLVEHQGLARLAGLDFNAPASKTLGQGSYRTKNGTAYHQDVYWVRDYHPLVRFVPVRRGAELVYQAQVIEYVYPFSTDGRPVSVDFEPPKAPGYPDPETRKLRLLIRGGDTLWTPGTESAPGFFLTSERTLAFNDQGHEQLAADAQAWFKRYQEAGSRYVANGSEWTRNFYEWAGDGLGPGNVRRDRSQVVAELARAARVPESHVVIAPWLPGSKTGDVDEYVAHLTGNAVAVARIDEESLEARGFEHERAYARGLNAFLDARAKEFAERGLTVERLPMFAPVNLKPNQFGGWNPDFLPTVNWARVNNHVYVPDYRAYLVKHGHPAELVERVQARIAQQVRETLKRYGMSAEFVDAGGLMEVDGQTTGPNGAFHCVTAVEYQVRRPPAAPKT
jgi:hypothetical protein